ncbi:DUF6323 family protein [Intestinibacter sp.]
MENNILKFTMNDLQEQSSEKLMKLNDESINYGLVLSEKEVNDIMKNTGETLKKIGRIETSTNALEKVITIVYSSPYTDKENYVENINDMQELFYYFKNQVLDLLSDDEVIEILEKAYDEKCGEIVKIQGFVEEFATQFKLGGHF